MIFVYLFKYRAHWDPSLEEQEEKVERSRERLETVPEPDNSGAMSHWLTGDINTEEASQRQTLPQWTMDALWSNVQATSTQSQYQDHLQQFSSEFPVPEIGISITHLLREYIRGFQTYKRGRSCLRGFAKDWRRPSRRRGSAWKGSSERRWYEKCRRRGMK